MSCTSRLPCQPWCGNEGKSGPVPHPVPGTSSGAWFRGCRSGRSGSWSGRIGAVASGSTGPNIVNPWNYNCTFPLFEAWMMEWCPTALQRSLWARIVVGTALVHMRRTVRRQLPRMRTGRRTREDATVLRGIGQRVRQLPLWGGPRPEDPTGRTVLPALAGRKPGLKPAGQPRLWRRSRSCPPEPFSTKVKQCPRGSKEPAWQPSSGRSARPVARHGVADP